MGSKGPIRRITKMALGIHRFVITFGPDVVKVRAQSQSKRGNAYTVRHAKRRPAGKDKVEIKAAIVQSIQEVFAITD
jgi:hypothetical protein